MLIEFAVGNYRSIKEIQTLSMVAGNIVSKSKELDELNVVQVTEKWKLLKSKAIYGANASGKSNIIRAMVAFIRIVNNSVKDDSVLYRFIEEFRLSSDCDDQPSFFQIMLLIGGVFYRYGFEATRTAIISEWLYGTPGKKEVQFFLRQEDDITINEKQFSEGSKLKELVRKDALFLTVVKSLNGEISKKVSNFIYSIAVIPGLSDQEMIHNAIGFLENETERPRLVEMLKVADTGIQDIVKIDIKEDEGDGNIVKEERAKYGRVVIGSAHQKLDVKTNTKFLIGFDFLLNESEGSKKMFEISPVILRALERGIPVIIDEFDARFHPLLSKKLVQLFNSSVNIKSQFIFATHDTNLLDASVLRRDQICFVEKDQGGASHFYTLAEFKGVRNDASFEKDYISGKYGAIPFLGDFNSLFDIDAEENKSN
ncbi:AAA family ATPase [Pedobacter psychroterrae]|uniref:ATP-binding protein n=1 Tax=Pedobacter psychroterrae TaxID=2530453 RepID=A0A4R0NAP0_9SPHI|nr:ATP-binding protein [Pedobacter psychroterrae]TCC97339.1 ATP-binding protein [Pedobacter psychroterrae]